MQRFFLLAFVLCLAAACRSKEKSPPQNRVASVEAPKESLLDLVKKSPALFPVESADAFAGAAIIVVRCPADEEHQIEKMAEETFMLASYLFADADFYYDEISVYANDRDADNNYLHYINLERKSWQEIQDFPSSDYIAVYDAARSYYIGAKVKGRLEFNLNGMTVHLPVQKPLAF